MNQREGGHRGATFITCHHSSSQLYGSNDQKARERAEEALLSALGATPAAVSAARATVSTHGGASARLDVHLVGSHPTCLATQLSILGKATSGSLCMFAATCVKGCVEHYYQQMPDKTAATLQAQLWNLILQDAAAPSPRMPAFVKQSVLYTVCRIASLAWVDDEAVREVAVLCLARLNAVHAGSRSILAMKQAGSAAGGAADHSSSNIPFEVASYIIQEHVRILAVSALRNAGTKRQLVTHALQMPFRPPCRLAKAATRHLQLL